MAKRGVKDLFVQVLVGANVVTAILMFVTGYSCLVNPLTISESSVLGLFFPFFMLLDIIFLVFWIFFYWRKAYIPVLALILCYFPVCTFYGLNSTKEVPNGSIKVMSYNVFGFRGLEGKELSRDSNELIQYLCKEDCDIVCLQESNEDWLSESCKDNLYKKYPYHHEATKNRYVHLAIYTKYRIEEVDSIHYNSRSNYSMYYRLKIGEEDVYVINNYLEITHISVGDRTQFSEMMRGNMGSGSAKAESRSVLSSLIESAKKRAPQARAVAKFIEDHKDSKIILMGDFNDNPISYTHHTIGKNLTDCFIHTGKGLGWTYCHHAMRVRIDNIMCSETITPYDCKVDDWAEYSDHYPIKCWLKFD